jgi:hypothetical protein
MVMLLVFSVGTSHTYWGHMPHESCKVPTKNSGYMPPTTLCLVLFQLRVQGGTSLLGYFDGRKQGN